MRNEVQPGRSSGLKPPLFSQTVGWKKGKGFISFEMEKM
jgi:hypothetical protein